MCQYFFNMKSSTVCVLLLTLVVALTLESCQAEYWDSWGAWGNKDKPKKPEDKSYDAKTQPDDLKKNKQTRNAGRGKYGGAVYVRWGRTVCPSHSERIYEGYAAGSHSTHNGGGSTKLCLPKEPEFDRPRAGFQSYGHIYGAEYEIHSNNPFSSKNLRGHALHNGDVVCAVCLATSRPSHVIIPAKKTCPAGWLMEYHGFLMSEAYTHHKSSYDCMDIAPEIRNGGAAYQGGALFYVTETSCGSLPCPPYSDGYELTCVVCTR